MKNQLAEKRMEKMYKDYYADYNAWQRPLFEKKEEKEVKGLVSWNELPADSKMYELKILVGKEVL
jgi:hypothetical protein